MGSGAVDCVDQDIGVDDDQRSPTLGQASRQHIILEPRSDLQCFGEIHSGRSESTRRRERRRTLGTGSESGTDRCVDGILERQASLAHRTLNQQPGVWIQADGSTHN